MYKDEEIIEASYYLSKDDIFKNSDDTCEHIKFALPAMCDKLKECANMSNGIIDWSTLQIGIHSLNRDILQHYYYTIDARAKMKLKNIKPVDDEDIIKTIQT